MIEAASHSWKCTWVLGCVTGGAITMGSHPRVSFRKARPFCTFRAQLPSSTFQLLLTSQPPSSNRHFVVVCCVGWPRCELLGMQKGRKHGLSPWGLGQSGTCSRWRRSHSMYPRPCLVSCIQCSSGVTTVAASVPWHGVCFLWGCRKCVTHQWAGLFLNRLQTESTLSCKQSHMPHLECENLATTESSRDEIKVMRLLRQK